MEVKSSYRNGKHSNVIKIEIFGRNELADQANETGVEYTSKYDADISKDCVQGDAKSHENISEERSSVVSIRVHNNFCISQLARKDRELLLDRMANSVCRGMLMFFCSTEELKSYDKNKENSPF
ncbi:MAG: hypothetical protein AAGU21_15665 [Solidesulfovibrio sp.]|uniref:hypothetical protein n=1 Tax=Solidesulfovibrio sp. TaxID=2910990 RepID=UPI0031593607